MAEEICLNIVEVQAFWDVGFDLQHIGPSHGRPTQEGTPHRTDLDICSTHCAGKPIVISKRSQKKWMKESRGLRIWFAPYMADIWLWTGSMWITQFQLHIARKIERHTR